MEHYDAVIIGAGFWGLCAAHTFLTVDPAISLLVLDTKKTIGGVWAKEQLYPGLRSNNLQGYYEFSDFPMLEAGLGIKPQGILHGEAIQEYLHKYAEHFNLQSRIRLDTEVIRASENDGQNPTWSLELRSTSDDSSTSRISCSKLIVATGQASIPKKLKFAGLENFTKPAIHSHDLGRTAPSLLADESINQVTIIGGSKSAHDAVYMFASAGRK